MDSNDSLYGGDSKFLAENNKLCETVMAQILEHLKTLAKDEVGAPGGPAAAARSAGAGLQPGGCRFILEGSLPVSDAGRLSSAQCTSGSP